MARHQHIRVRLALSQQTTRGLTAAVLRALAAYGHADELPGVHARLLTAANYHEALGIAMGIVSVETLKRQPSTPGPLLERE